MNPWDIMFLKGKFRFGQSDTRLFLGEAIISFWGLIETLSKVLPDGKKIRNAWQKEEW
jgi:hypothetical protein